jgi:hypothetical protein
MDYIVYAAIAVVAFWLGWKFNEKIMFITFAKMMKEAGITNRELDKFVAHFAPKLREEGLLSEEEADQHMEQIEVKLEQHGTAIYAFRKDNDQFLGQGTDKESLIARLAETMRNVRLVISQEDGGALIGGNVLVRDKEIVKD